jgi:hypothetical protein
MAEQAKAFDRLQTLQNISGLIDDNELPAARQMLGRLGIGGSSSDLARLGVAQSNDLVAKEISEARTSVARRDVARSDEAVT